MKDIPKDLMRDLLALACEDGLQCKLVEYFDIDKFCGECDPHCETCAERLIHNMYKEEQKTRPYIGCKVLVKTNPYDATWGESIYAGYQMDGNGFTGGHYCTDDGGNTLYRACGEPIVFEWEDTGL